MTFDKVALGRKSVPGRGRRGSPGARTHYFPRGQARLIFDLESFKDSMERFFFL